MVVLSTELTCCRRFENFPVSSSGQSQDNHFLLTHFLIYKLFKHYFSVIAFLNFHVVILLQDSNPGKLANCTFSTYIRNRVHWTTILYIKDLMTYFIMYTHGHTTFPNKNTRQIFTANLIHYKHNVV